jgi:hypothetical protein
VVKTINEADHAGKTLAYFSLETGNMVDVEPASGGFDLLYERYTTKLWDLVLRHGLTMMWPGCYMV